MLILFNTSDGQPTPCVDYTGRHCEVVALQGKLEMDIAQLPVEDRSLFMQEYGIEETGLIRVINQSYCLMDIQSFFTVGEDEVHAWAVPVGASALEAAGAIHTDLQKGFIRAEVIPNEVDRPWHSERGQEERKTTSGRQGLHRPRRGHRPRPLQHLTLSGKGGSTLVTDLSYLVFELSPAGHDAATAFV